MQELGSRPNIQEMTMGTGQKCVVSAPNCENESNCQVGALKCFYVMFLNVQSLENKILDLEVTLSLSNYDVLCFSEHWLTEDLIMARGLNGYILASAFCRTNLKHGGIALYVSNALAECYKVVNVSEFCCELHHEFVCIVLPKTNLVLVGVYRSPNGDFDLFLSALESLVLHLNRFRSKHHILVGGDFNVDVRKEDHKSSTLQNVLKSLNLYCKNFEPTRDKACLDNVATDLNNDSILTNVINVAISDHDMLSVKIKLEEESLPVKSDIKLTKKFTESELQFFVYELEKVRWNEVLLSSCGEVNFELFLNKFLMILEVCVPTRKCKTNPKVNKKKKIIDVKWCDDALLKKRNWLLLIYDLYKSNRTSNLKDLFIKVKKEYRSDLRQAKLKLNANAIENAPNKCAAAWNVIKKETTPSHQRLTTLLPDEFGQFFADAVQHAREAVGIPVLSAQQMLESSPRFPENFVLELVETTPREVAEVVRKMKKSKSKDIYSLSNSLIKLVIFYIVVPLTFCINMCIRQSKFPKILKVSKTVPIHKKGSWDCVENFRPVAILPIFSKIFEAILQRQLYSYFESKNLLTSSQYGFRSGRSTIDAVDCLVNQILSGFEQRSFTGVTFCDLSKAFDTVDHEILLSKLKHYGVKEKSVKLLESYLGDREQIVCVNGVNSAIRKVEHGVPQGSVLGPLLFLIIVNDIPYNIDAGIVSYADDTSLVLAEQNLKALETAMEQSLEQAATWFRANYFLLNPAKTQSVIFSLRQMENDEKNVKLLGIVLDTKLTWSSHIDQVCSRLSRILYLLRNLKFCVPPDYVKTAYRGLFESVILYGLRLWGGAPEAKRVLIIQKKAIRSLAGAVHDDEHCKPLFKSEGLMTIFSMYVFVCLLKMKDEYDVFRQRGSLYDYNTRSRHLIDVPFVRLKKSQIQSNILSIKFFNRIPCEARTQPFSKFKINAQKLLLAYPLYSWNEFLEIPAATVSTYFK